MTKETQFKQIASKKYWDNRSLNYTDNVKLVRTLPEDTPAFILKHFIRLEYKISNFSFEGSAGLILDAGCGTGNILNRAEDTKTCLNFEYVGIDFSRNILKKARLNTGDKRDFLQASVTYLPFKNRSFDRIICSGVITYLSSIKEVEGLLSEFSRVLKPGGILITDFHNKLAPSIIVLSYLRPSYTKTPKYMSPFGLYNILQNLGFKVINERGFNFCLFSGYQYQFRGKWKVMDPFFIQERISEFMENKIAPKIPLINIISHRIFLKCEKL